MSHYGVIGTPTAVSHLPSISATLIENETYEDQDLQLRPTLSNQASTSSYPSPPRSATLIELTNRIKEEETSHSDQPFHIQPSTEIHPVDYNYGFHQPQPLLSSTSQPPFHSAQFEPFHEHQHHHNHTPPASTHLPYNSTLHSHSPLRSPNLLFSSQHHHHQQPQQQPQQQSQQNHHHHSHQQENSSFCQTSSLYTPSNFHSDNLLAHSDPFRHSPPWSHSQHGDPLDLHSRNVSLSTPISSKALSSSDSSARHCPLSRLLAAPYQLDSPEPISSNLDAYHLSSFGLSNIDGNYPFNNHHQVYQNHQFGSHPNHLKELHQMTANTDHQHRQHHYYHQSDDYASRSPPARLQQPFPPPPRLPSTPSDSFPPLLPSHLAQSASKPLLGQKRKYDADFSQGNFPSKVSRTSPLPAQSSQLSLNTIGLESGHERMTTVLCLHASVAQKSYGQEKRFLCPPPLVRITGPYRKLPKSHRPILSMSILNEDGQKHLCQTALLGEEGSNVLFKSLHISGAAKKAKHVNLELSLHPPLLHDPKPLQNIGPDMKDLMPAFATFRSSDCNIISKPSKKTAKARNTQSCIFNGSTVCLFNRINSQTVRTKYLCVQDGKLAARAAQWSAFTIRVIRRAEDAGADGTPPIAGKTLLSSSVPGADRTVTYGSEVELIDFVTGVSSGPLIIRKVEKNIVQKDATGPVSQMQKLAFCKVDKVAGPALYISALEGVPPPASPQNDVTEAPSASELLPNPDGTDSSGLPLGPPLYPASTPPVPRPQTSRMLHMLQLQFPRSTLPPEDPEGILFDEIDDSVAWTVIGVAHFSHSFIDLSHYYPQIPQLPITPFPSLTAPPQVDLHALTITLRVAGFFDAHARPMEVWLGPIGALETQVSATSGLTLESNFGDGGSNENSGSSGLRLQVSSDASNGWTSLRKGGRRESTLLVTLPPLETVYWTLHRKNMPSRSVVVLDESGRPMRELLGRKADGGGKNEDGHTNTPNHIPALPITLIRADGISFVMGHSICLSEVNHEAQKENEDISKTMQSESGRSHTLILRVI